VSVVEDKSFELITKMYSEITDRLNQIDKKLDSKADKTDIVRMENELKPKVEIALEGYQAVSGKLTVLEDKIDNLTSKVESQDVQITVLKGSKKAAK
jgi:tetrahydromethanopterin S-methyltransferase subunit G